MITENNNPIIAAPTTNDVVPAKWETPELFKTEFENTEGKTPFTSGNTPN